MGEMTAIPKTSLRATAVYTLGFAIVYGYVNTFTLWRSFGRTFGEGLRDALPWIMVGLIVLGVTVFLLWRRAGAKVSWPLLAVAVLAAIIGLSITDPAFPAKRIHVPQYFLLAGVIWLALPGRLRTPMSPVFVLVAVAMYGVHDEFLQGFHPRRTFGLRDMTVNLCGAASGVFALLAFSGGSRASLSAFWRSICSAHAMAGVLACVAGVVLLAWAAMGYRNDFIPYWAVLPGLAGAFWLALSLAQVDDAGDRISLGAIIAICCVFLAYPVLTHVTYLDFA